VSIATNNSFCCEQLKSRYAPQIRQALDDITGRKCFIDFSVEAGVETNKNLPAEEPLFSAPRAKALYTNGESLNPIHLLDNYVVGKSNSLAYAAGCAVSENPGQAYNPLFIYGGVGVGKTHLMQAVGNKILSKFPQTKLVYTTCERFTNEFVDSLTFKKSAAFRNKFRKAEVLLIDDIQFLSGRESTQEEFFHTFNELHGQNSQIVLTCDRHPAELGRIEERLVSRFLGGLTVDIGQPDLEMRMAILKAKCQDRGIIIDNNVFEFIASKITNNARELDGGLIKLLSISKLNKRPPDLDLAKEIFSHRKQDTNLKVKPNKVLSIVARHFGISVSQLTGKKRNAHFVQPRQITMFILRDELGLTLPEVGRLLGNRDHTTIIYGVDKISRQIDVDEGIKKELTLIRQSIMGYN
jgi:chromosomal replication initiator protein